MHNCVVFKAAALFIYIVLDGSVNTRVKAEAITVAQCDPSLQQDIAPLYFQVFMALEGETKSISEFVQIMARFPDGVCNLPDPEQSGPGCTPKLNVVLSKLGANGVTNDVTIEGARGVSRIAKRFGLDYSMQEGFYDEILGIPSTPWLFYLQVDAGMSTQASGGLLVNWIEIPKECNLSPITFNTSKIFYDSNALRPKISINTFPPELEKIYTTESDGNFTAGDSIDIIVQFSGPVKFSQQPDIYSQVWLQTRLAHQRCCAHHCCCYCGQTLWARSGSRGYSCASPAAEGGPNAGSSTSTPGSPTR
jgi:hypothetical protein